jgi:hypothetical protein
MSIIIILLGQRILAPWNWRPMVTCCHSQASRNQWLTQILGYTSNQSWIHFEGWWHWQSSSTASQRSWRRIISVSTAQLFHESLKKWRCLCLRHESSKLQSIRLAATGDSMSSLHVSLFFWTHIVVISNGMQSLMGLWSVVSFSLLLQLLPSKPRG